MGLSNLVVKAVDTFPQAMPRLVSQKKQKPKVSFTNKKSFSAMTVGELLSSTQTLPEKSLLLGRCADGLPFFMSIDDPEMGSILISGARGCGKTHQLQVIVDAAIRTNRPHELQITVITHNPSEWRLLQDAYQSEKYLQGVYAWYDPNVGDHIQHLTEVVEARREGEYDGPVNLVILDDLNFVETLPCEAQVNLRWLLEYGSQSNFWMVGALNASLVQRLPFWLEVFRTRLFGWMQDEIKHGLPGQQHGLHPDTLEPGTFRAWTGGSWITYQLPLLGKGVSRRK